MVASTYDAASPRLKADLRSSLLEAHKTGRLVLTHLNADSTWLLSLPYPPSSQRPPNRCRYNMILDPWLRGAQIDVACWFSSQTHVIQSTVQAIAELNAILAELEAELLHCEVSKSVTYIDLVAISHEFTDHCHEATLKELDPRVPVFATSKAVELVKSWNHFNRVINMAPFVKDVDWRTTSVTPLPDWIGHGRLITEGNALYFHSAIVICIQKAGSDGAAEAVIYTPHGVESETFATVSTAKPAVETLAFMHGLHDVSITLTKQLNLGAHNALKAQELLKARYWVGTHDEVKKGTSLIGPLLRRKQHTIEDALSKAKKWATGESGTTIAQTATDVAWAELGNGESLLLR